MTLLIGIPAVLAIMYGWLIGNWFARVLMFLILTALIAVVTLVAADPKGAVVFLAVILAGVAAWFLSGIPIYYWRRNDRKLTEAAFASRNLSTYHGSGGGY